MLAIDSGINVFDLSEAHSGKPHRTNRQRGSASNRALLSCRRYKSRGGTRKDPVEERVEKDDLHSHHQDILEYEVFSETYYYWNSPSSLQWYNVIYV